MTCAIRSPCSCSRTGSLSPKQGANGSLLDQRDGGYIRASSPGRESPSGGQTRRRHGNCFHRLFPQCRETALSEMKTAALNLNEIRLISSTSTVHYAPGRSSNLRSDENQ